MPLSDLDRGIALGLICKAGSFGGDGVKPALTIKLHVRHADLLAWMTRTFPGTRVYGPYESRDGTRHWLEWRARGRALKDGVLPALEGLASLDAHQGERMAVMCRNYGLAVPDRELVEQAERAVTARGARPAAGVA